MNLRWFIRRQKSRWRNFILGVQSLWYYLPVIWKSRDWDYQYIDELQLHAFKRLRRSLMSRDHVHVSRKFYSQMRDVELLLQRLYDDEYTSTADWAKKPYVGAEGSNFDYMHKQDMEYLHKLMQKHWLKYWD